MKDTNDILKVGLAQIAPVWLDRDKTLQKVCGYIEDAAYQGCELVVFGEALVPGYPFWVERTDGAKFNSQLQKEMYAHTTICYPPPVFLSMSCLLSKGYATIVKTQLVGNALDILLGGLWIHRLALLLPQPSALCCHARTANQAPMIMSPPLSFPEGFVSL